MLAPMQGAKLQDATGDNWTPQSPPADSSDAIFARRLRAIRELADMTQQQLADEMARTGSRIHRSTIGKIENGDRPVTVGEAVQLASILGVDLAELVTDPGADTARTKARIAVRALEREAAERFTELEEAGVLLENATARLKAARRRLAELEDK